MKATNTIQQIIEESSNIERIVNDRIAVIVLTNFSARKAIYGVQFWTSEMISNGQSINTDNTISRYIQTL